MDPGQGGDVEQPGGTRLRSPDFVMFSGRRSAQPLLLLLFSDKRLDCFFDVKLLCMEGSARLLEGKGAAAANC